MQGRPESALGRRRLRVCQGLLGTQRIRASKRQCTKAGSARSPNPVIQPHVIRLGVAIQIDHLSTHLSSNRAEEETVAVAIQQQAVEEPPMHPCSLSRSSPQAKDLQSGLQAKPQAEATRHVVPTCKMTSVGRPPRQSIRTMESHPPRVHMAMLIKVFNARILLPVGKSSRVTHSLRPGRQ